jgi:ABC-type multidrug transport system fused ATPase/permease subunit
MPDFFEMYGSAYDSINTLIVPQGLTDKPEAVPLTTRHGAVEFRNLTFGYNTEKKIFDDLSLVIPAGQKVGLVGHSGGGKSTLVSLMLRLYDIQSGSIFIDGHNVAELTQESLRRHIALIPQDTILFHRTMRDNIRYARPEASDEEVIEAARKAHAHEFIAHLPKGYDTLVGERGIKLSGGQRQRVAIARAILKNAPILLLDEATSALDSESEAAIQASMAEVMPGKTVIAIAHRLSTIANMDRLLVLEHGRVVEDGSHAQLLSQGGVYAQLWRRQSGGFLVEG